MPPSRYVRAVADIERRSVTLATELNPSAVPLVDAGRLYDQLDRATRALTAAKTLLAPRVAESREWQRRGHRNPEEDLAARGGTSLAAAKNTMATGKALADNPELRTAMTEGDLSPDQGTVIADAAKADPDATDKLIETAKKANLNQLRDEAGRIKAAADPDPDATYRRLHRKRRLTRYTHTDGSRHLHLQGPVDLVSVIEAELDRCLSHHIRTLTPDTPHENRDTLAFDAAITMARRSTRADQTPTTTSTGRTGTSGQTSTRTEGTRTGAPDPAGTRANNAPDPRQPGPERPGQDDPDTGHFSTSDPPGKHATADTGDRGRDDQGSGASPGGSSPPRRRRRPQPAPEHLALLRIDIEALWRGHIEGDEICEITGLGPLPVSAARRLLGDAVIKLIITKGNAVAHVTSLTRGPTQAMRYALLWTNPQCSVEGCTRTILEHDHPYGAEYATTHHTRLNELDPLCHQHHKLRTHHGWALTNGTGKRPIVAPTDPNHPKNTPTTQPNAEPTSDRASTTTNSNPPPETKDKTEPRPDRGRVPKAAHPTQPNLFGESAA